MQELIDSLDTDLRYAIEVEGKLAMSDVENYEEVRDAIRESLEGLRDTPNREECPLIYHLDVAAMYPNIILTNRCAHPGSDQEVQCKHQEHASAVGKRCCLSTINTRNAAGPTGPGSLDR